MSDASSSADGRSFPRLGSYQILRQLGSGGMSNVFQAIHEESGSIVALKVLPRKLAQNAVLLQRFLREAKSAENLDHPNIVAIYDRGFDQGRHYLVLEFVEGRDLFDRVRMNGPMPWTEAVPFVREVALGLQYASRQGMIHRDVKPANLLLTPDGHAKIIDLGLALQADEEDERVTRDGTTVGTVDYMSPEQARDSRKLNERSDIYSLGCTLHYLVTGFPPFPGGNLADKLARHHSAKIPNVRDRVPDIPAEFASLVERMMAKKPEQRFADYQEMIDALDRLGKEPAPSPGGSLPDVLIDDDDDDVLELTLAGPGSQEIKPAPPSLPGTRRPESKRAQALDPAIMPEISLAELAGLDADQPSASSRTRALKPAPAIASRSSGLLDAILEDQDEEVEVGEIRRARDELPLQTWIAAGIMVGLVIATVAFGIPLILSLFRAPEPDPQIADPAGSPPGAASPESADTNGLAAAPTIPPPTASRPKPRDPTRNDTPPKSVQVAAPTQPQLLPEPVYRDELLKRLGLTRDPRMTPIESSGQVVVRRLVDPGDSTQTESISKALGRPNDVVEIADVGPFHEDDFQVAGKSRLVRGRAGYRPIVMVESTRQTLIREQEAKFLLGLNGVEQLTLEGIDLVVDVRDLPLTQSTLFLCQGVDLTLRDCTITIANAEDRKNGFSVFRLANGPRPNRLQLERCLVRGPIQTLAEIASVKAEVVLDRTVVASFSGSLMIVKAADRAERQLQFIRSVLLSREPIISWEGKPTATTVRSLGTRFIHVDPTATSPLLVARGAGANDPRTWLDYAGEHNRFVGWEGLAQWSGAARSANRVGAGLREIRPDADSLSQESAESWAVAQVAESVRAATYVDLVPEMAATLAMVAVPHPNLLNLTVYPFNRLAVPELLDDFSSQGESSQSRPVVSFTYNPQNDRQNDFGLFLQQQITDPSKHYLIRVEGTASQLMSPIRLPDGASVTILGPSGTGTANPVPIFFAARSGTAFFELHGGDLTLENLGFAGEGAKRTQSWIAVEDCVLAVRRCRYRDLTPSDDSALVIRAGSGSPGSSRAGGYQLPTDRPVATFKDCWVWTLSNGMAAEVIRSAVKFENCLIMAGNAAFVLKPITAHLADLEADLILENCTVMDERFGTLLDPSVTAMTGLGRPWLILSRSSVFPRIWKEGGALLGVEPNLFAQGVVFWQSSNDLYEVSRFLGPSVSQSVRSASADLKRHWIDLWGINHTRGDRGPDARNSDHVLFFREKDRSRTSRPLPTQLELDPKLHPGRGVNFKSLPPFPRS